MSNRDTAAAGDPVREQVRESVVARRGHGAGGPVGGTAGGTVPGEIESIDRFLVEFDRLSEPFRMDSDLVHVTGSAIVIGERGVVLLKHKRLGIWLQPGGHIDVGETPWEAALREATEETGLELELVDGELVHVDVHDGGRGHTHLDLRYLVRPVVGSDPTPRPPQGESQDVHWFDWDAAVRRAGDDRLRWLLASRRDWGGVAPF